MKFMIQTLLSLGLSFYSGSIGNAASQSLQIQKISGSVQGFAFPSIEIGVNGRGIMIDLGPESKLLELGISERMFEIGTQIEVTGKVVKGKQRDKMDVISIKIGDQEFTLK